MKRGHTGGYHMNGNKRTNGGEERSGCTIAEQDHTHRSLPIPSMNANPGVVHRAAGRGDWLSAQNVVCSVDHWVLR